MDTSPEKVVPENVVVFLPGAWGNRTIMHVAWWFDRVEDALREEGLLDAAVCVTYRGRTLEEVVENAYKQIKEANVPDGSMVVAYSLGAQVLRGLVAKDPELFGEKILICGLKPYGFGLVDIVRIFRTSPKLVFRSLLGVVPIPTRWEIIELFYSGRRPATNEILDMQSSMHEEQFWWVMAQVFLPGFRRAMPIFRERHGEVTAFVGADDCLVGGGSDWRESVNTVVVEGVGHSLIRDPALVYALRRYIAVQRHVYAHEAASK